MKVFNFSSSNNETGLSQEEYKELFDNFYTHIKNFIYFKVGDTALAEDIAQEVYVKIWEKRHTVKKETVKSLLYTIASNLVINHAKHQKVVYNFVNHRDHRKYSSSPEFELEYKEYKEKVENTIENLPEKCRTVFLMNRIEKMTYNEIAEHLGLSVKAVEKRMHKAMVIIKEKLNKKL